MVIRPLILLLSVTSISLSSIAADVVAPFWYAGLDVGQGYYDNGGNAQSYNSTRNRLAGGAHVGYQFNAYLSSELAYQYLGHPYAKYDDGEIEANFNQGVFSVRLGYPLTADFYPYIKLGGSAWYGETSGLNDHNAGGLSPLYGAGLSYALTEHLLIRYEYQFTQSIGDKGTGYSDHRWMALGLSWRFGQDPKISAPVRSVSITEVFEETLIVEQTTFVVSGLEGDTLFANNSSQLLNTKLLQKVLNFLQKHPQTSLTVIVHTDSMGREAYNLILSTHRAQAVANYLGQQGINLNRIMVMGKGESEPMATVSGRAMNRRVEMIVEPSKIDKPPPES